MEIQASRVRQLIGQTEDACQAHLDALVSTEALVEGSFVTVGRTRLVYVPAGDEVRIQRRAQQYRKLRHARAELVKLAARTTELADELQAALVEPYPEPDKQAKRTRRKRGSGGTDAAT